MALAVAFFGLLRGCDLPLGVGIAVGAALKLTPAALLVLLLWRRRWRAAGYALAGLAILTMAVLPLTGTAAFVDYAHSAVALMAPRRVEVSPQNQSFTGVVGRLLLKRTTSVSSPPVRTTHIAALAFAAALAILTALACWPRPWPRRRDTRDREGPARGRDGPPSHRLPEAWAFAAVLASSLLAGPFTWYHQFMFLLIPLLLVIEELVAGRHWRILAVVSTAIVLVNANETLYVAASHWIDASGVWRALSFPFLLAFGLWAYACLRARRLQASRVSG